MGRRPLFKDEVQVACRMDKMMYRRLLELAAIQTTQNNNYTSAQELIREAITFCYFDNERLRKLFYKRRQIFKKSQKERRKEANRRAYVKLQKKKKEALLNEQATNDTLRPADE